jgi:hypothetical protein
VSATSAVTAEGVTIDDIFGEDEDEESNTVRESLDAVAINQ